MIIDCTLKDQTSYTFPSGNNYQMGGCGGGWMEYAWWFMTTEGVMLESDYPNESHLSNKEYDCRFKPDKILDKKMRGWGTITGKDDVTAANVSFVK